ncbi:hypothetical protein KCP77_10885 [Salmonella enterica subsp. enterica]|nr:hypothetical protein KCP77_10885 [Salmonella enterica subsp. enterica]
MAYGCIAICRCCRTQARVHAAGAGIARKVTRWSPSNRTVCGFAREVPPGPGFLSIADFTVGERCGS